MRGLRIFLVLLGACAAVGALVVVLLWRSYGPSVRAMLDQMTSEAEEFAHSHTQSDCVPEALARVDGCDGVLCQAQAPAFTRICLRRAAHSPNLCHGVPDSLVGAALWPQDECADIDAPSEICKRILRELATTCIARSASTEP